MKLTNDLRVFSDTVSIADTRALWSPGNDSLYSDLFSVSVGSVCVLFATNLERDKVKVDDSEFVSPQSICVHRLVYTANRTYKQNAVCEVVAITDAPVLVADEIVQTCRCRDKEGNCWILTQSNNIGIIGLPGIYRLELNDATAIGVAQVYAELYPADSLPAGMDHLFF